MLTIMLTINMMFIFLNHPMSMGLMMIIQTLIISMFTGKMMKTFWLSYLLTITMLSGMLVLFIYMSSMASNEKFKTSTKMLMWLTIMVMTLMLFLSLLKKMIIKNNYSGMEMNLNKYSEIVILMKMFNKNNMMITIMMVVYLFMTMIVSSKLVNITEGPMRSKI